MGKLLEEKLFKNTNINIFGSIWKIRFTKEIIKDKDSDNTYWGMAYYDRQLIEVSLVDGNNKPRTYEDICITLLHELTHAFLSEGGYHETNNEPLVEWVGKCYNMIINHTKLFK